MHPEHVARQIALHALTYLMDTASICGVSAQDIALMDSHGAALAAVDPTDDRAVCALMYSQWDRAADLWCWTVGIASGETPVQYRYLIRHMYTGSVRIGDLGDVAHRMLDRLLWPQEYADGSLAAVVSRCLIWSATLQLRHLVDLDLSRLYDMRRMVFGGIHSELCRSVSAALCGLLTGGIEHA